MLPLLYFGFSVPNDSYDLSRYYVMIEHMQGMQLHDLFNTESTWSSYISGTEECTIESKTSNVMLSHLFLCSTKSSYNTNAAIANAIALRTPEISP